MPRGRVQAAIGRDRLDGADLVVGMHDRDQRRIRPQCRSHGLRVDDGLRIHRHHGDIPTIRAQAQHRLHEGGCSMALVTRCRLVSDGARPTPEHRQVIGLGGAAGENDLVGLRADQRGDLGASLTHRLPRARCPNTWAEAGLPKSASKTGRIACTTSGATGVVAL